MGRQEKGVVRGVGPVNLAIHEHWDLGMSETLFGMSELVFLLTGYKPFPRSIPTVDLTLMGVTTSVMLHLAGQSVDYN